RAAREVFVGQRRAEQLVVDPEVVRGDARLGNAGRAAGLEDEDRLPVEAAGNPALHGTAAQPLVLEFAEAAQIGERPDLTARLPSGLRGELEPERRPGHRVEVPVDDLPEPRVERLLRPAGWRLRHGIVV